MLVNSSFIKSIVSASLKAEALILSPPVDVQYFLRSDKKIDRADTIITLSGYSPKRHLEKIPEIASRLNFGDFLIIGKTDEYSFLTIKNLKVITKQYGVEGRVHLLANISRSKLRKALLEAKLYLHTMPNEHFGTAIVEAMASGCIPIVHKSGGPWLDILEQTQGKYGYAYETPEEASKYIDFLLNQETLRKEVSLRVVERSMVFDVSIFQKKIVGIIEKIYAQKTNGEKGKCRNLKYQ
jgi:alpha-1,2-mannosyltransferase